MALPLSVRDLRVESERGRTLLEIGALDISAGSRVGIRGPSGAGKSTLLYALAGLLPLAAGSVSWGETRLSSLGRSQRARFRRNEIGLIFQDFLLFEELPALDNAALAAAYCDKARRGHIVAGAVSMLTHLGLGDHRARTVDTFSGGERQRVAVSRALAGDPAIILADEPTASLDRKAADGLIEDLVSLAETRGKTLIAVSHDAALHARMERVIDIADGRWTGEAG